MAKKSSIEKNERRRRMSKTAAPRRAKLKAIAKDKNRPLEERFAATLKLAQMPRNSVADPHSQSLRSDRASARVLPQAEDEPHRAA